MNPAHIEPVTHAVNMQRSPKARLSPAEVAIIRAAHASGLGVRFLARRHGVNHATVSRIVNGLTWPPDDRRKDVAA